MKFKEQERNRLKIIALGGFGHVTQNLFVYEYRDDILVVDCGIGFPDEESPEGDLIIPDISYLVKNKDKIRGIVLTHGHEDHIGGLPFALRSLRKEIPLYGSRLTTALIKEKLAEYGVTAPIITVKTDNKISLGSFSVEFIHITHSIPGTFNLVISTPLGTIYHAGDFKFDWTPPLEVKTEVGKIALAGDKGVLLLLSDCLRSEKPGYTLSETMVKESLEREIRKCSGKFLVTTMSSNVSRWKQALEVIIHHQRRVAFVGRSVEKIIKIASQLGYLRIPQKMIIKAKEINRFRPQEVAILVAGSQAQAGSSLERIAGGQYPGIKIKPGDKVVFSADYIPGNEVAIHRLIDNLSRQGADVSYSDILDDLHVSGHASAEELALMLALTRPKYILPIGGAFRQMKQYSLLAQKMGYQQTNVLMPSRNQTVEILPGGQVYLGGKMDLRTKLVSSKINRPRKKK